VRRPVTAAVDSPRMPGGYCARGPGSSAGRGERANKSHRRDRCSTRGCRVGERRHRVQGHVNEALAQAVGEVEVLRQPSAGEPLEDLTIALHHGPQMLAKRLVLPQIPLPASDLDAEDGAFMEPSGGNQWQPLANASGPKRLKQADPQPSATHGNRPRPHADDRRPALDLRYESSAEVQAALARLGFEQRFVLLLLAGSEKVDDALASGVQELGDQAPVAAPPECLRTHEARRRLRERRTERRLPPFAAHASGIATERRHAQTVERILTRLTDEATAEFHGVPVGDPALLERSSESGLVELRIVTRTREAPHIDERDDARLANNRREFVDGPSPVADRPNDHHLRMPRFPIFRTSVGHRGIRQRDAPS
jgi:hypothetical protein